jgi:hypothetical protein
LQHIESKVHDGVGPQLGGGCAQALHREPLLVEVAHADDEAHFLASHGRVVTAEELHMGRVDGRQGLRGGWARAHAGLIDTAPRRDERCEEQRPSRPKDGKT